MYNDKVVALFSAMDMKGNLFLMRDELIASLGHSGLHGANADRIVQAIFTKVDEQNKGFITKEEFDQFFDWVGTRTRTIYKYVCAYFT
jgi:Ca2+-binding EF-hand superfamily protein